MGTRRSPLGHIDAAVHPARGEEHGADHPVRARPHPRHQALRLLDLAGAPQHLHHARVVLQSRPPPHRREHPPPFVHHPGPRARGENRGHRLVVHLLLRKAGEEVEDLPAPAVSGHRAGQRRARGERPVPRGQFVEQIARGGEVAACGVGVDEGR
ncbi:Os11g0158350, partial [Oryza sativa Japonica Group]